MFIVEESNSIMVYNQEGKLMYKSFSIVQYKKFNANNLVVITQDSIDYINQIKTDKGYDILVTSDTKFISAVIYDKLIFVQRQLLMPIMDVYDNNFINVLRLYQNVKGEWVHFITKLRVPVKSVVPTHLEGKLLFGTRKGKPCVVNLEQGTFKKINRSKNAGIPLQQTIQKFKEERVK